MTSGLWRDPNGRAITVNSSDQALFEWLLAYGAHARHPRREPALHHLLNVPHGVNLAVNTSITVYAVVFAPLTYLVGPPATFLVILTLNLAAHRPRLVLAALPAPRRATGSPPALGGLFIGFAPGMVSHANAHLNWTAGWLVPLLIWRVFQLRAAGPLAAQRADPRRARRRRLLHRRRRALLHRPGAGGLPRRLGGCTRRTGARYAPHCPPSSAGSASPP